jgi:hypothetical protein
MCIKNVFKKFCSSNVVCGPHGAESLKAGNCSAGQEVPAAL